MLTKFLDVFGTATDVRSIAAVVIGTLVTVLGHNSVVVKAVIDGVAGVLVIVDTFQIHKSQQQAAAQAAQKAAPAPPPAPLSSTTTTAP